MAVAMCTSTKHSATLCAYMRRYRDAALSLLLPLPLLGAVQRLSRFF